jgi:hypothetical protein
MKILDLAGGSNPYFLRYELKWKPEDEYFYFDSDVTRLKKAKEKILKSENKPEENKTYFLIGDSIKLPFDENYFDQIIVSNFLSAPIHWQWDEKTNEVKILTEARETRRPILQIPEEFDLFYNERKQTVAEIYRVLKLNSKLIIFTDLIVYAQDSYNKILNELKQDIRFKFSQLVEEERRVDALNLNKRKIKSEEYCPCFIADVLPKSEVYELIKIKIICPKQEVQILKTQTLT